MLKLKFVSEMNWKALNEAYPLAFLEWVKHCAKTERRVTANVVELITYGWIGFEASNGKRDMICIGENTPLQLPEYFDALGIHVNTYQVDEAAKALREFAGLDTKHGYSVTVKSPNVWEGATYTTRREALEAGVMKAFEIREEQLKQKEK